MPSQNEIVNAVLGIPDVGQSNKEAIKAVINGIASSLIDRYRWKFREKEGQTTTVADQRTYTLKGGENNDANDCMAIINVRLGDTGRYFTLIDKDEYQQSQSESSTDSGLPNKYWIEGRDGDFPIIGINGSITADETLYYRYYKMTESTAVDSLPHLMQMYVFHEAMASFDPNPNNKMYHDGKARDYKKGAINLYRDLTFKHPETSGISIQERNRVWAINRRYRRR